MVFVLDKSGKPLMPCTNVIARLLLAQNKAKVKRKTPFTIKLNYDSTAYIQPVSLGLDTGSSKIGTAALIDGKNVVYMSQIKIRNDISTKMSRRSMYRKARRNKNTRYRECRFLNRKNSTKKNRLAPTLRSKIQAHLKELDFVKSVLPISEIILETATFDIQVLKDPSLIRSTDNNTKIKLQYANTKAFVLDRDFHTCQNCKGKSKNKRLEVHHIIFKTNGGSDSVENLITLCKACHDSVHNGTLSLKLLGKRKGMLKHASQMNVINSQLLKHLPNAKTTFGFITKENRQMMNLPKEHFIDAVVIASSGLDIKFKTASVLYKRCVPKGEYRQTRGSRSQQKMPTGKIFGFRKFDKVLYNRKAYFIKGRISNYGYAFLEDIEGNEFKFRPIPKLDSMKRLQARNSWLLHEANMEQNI